MKTNVLKRHSARRWLQFRLRTLLLAMLILGPLAGLGGPPAYRAWREWSQKEPNVGVMMFGAGVNSNAGVTGVIVLDEKILDESDSYFESAETPLD